MNREEDALQKSVMKQVAWRYPKLKDLIFHVPNEGKRTQWEGKNLKDKGLKKGVPDIIGLIPRRGYPGMCIELKTGKKQLTDEQENFKDLSEKEGYCFRVYRNIDDVMEFLDWYLGDKENAKINHKSQKEVA